MTTPTQAQIALDALEKIKRMKPLDADGGGWGDPYYELCVSHIAEASRALTAAAQVSEVRALKADASDVQTHRPLTPAQVGEHTEVNLGISDDWDGTNEYSRKLAEIRDAKVATIERCAQVVESFIPYKDTEEYKREAKIAAAIRGLAKEPVYAEHLRKLKDEP